MAKSKDEKKRKQILSAACTLFARKGFAGTSIADIAVKTRLPIGSVYTYFPGKEKIISVIVEEGWSQLKSELEVLCYSQEEPKKKLNKLITEFLPEFLKNADFINILLSECVKYTRIEKKVAELTELIKPVFDSLILDKKSINQKMLTASMMIYILGSLESARLLGKSSLKLTVNDLVQYIKHSAEIFTGMNLK